MVSVQYAVLGLLSLASLCSCQFEDPMALMLLAGGGGGLGGLGGGLGGLGGGLGGFGGGLGGLGGGLGGLATQLGGGRNMMMAGMTGMTGDMSPMDKLFLTRAVKTIVGQHAEPDLAMIRYAGMQGGRPVTSMQMIPYLEAMFQLAKKVGVGMPDGTVAHLAVPNQKLTLADKMSGRKTITERKMKELMTQRGMRWLRSQTMARATNGFFF